MSFANPHFAEPQWLWLAVVAPLVLAALQRYSAWARRKQLAQLAAPHFVEALTCSYSPVRRATNRRELQHIYDEIDSLEKTEVKLRRFTTYRPLYQWPLLAAFGLFALEMALANTRLRRVP